MDSLAFERAVVVLTFLVIAWPVLGLLALALHRLIALRQPKLPATSLIEALRGGLWFFLEVIVVYAALAFNPEAYRSNTPSSPKEREDSGNISEALVIAVLLIGVVGMLATVLLVWFPGGQRHL